MPRLLRPAVGVSPERLEAMEEWVRNLAGVLGTNTSLATGITRTLSSTPEEIRPEVETLVARIQARRPLTSALYAFADDLDDQTGDYVATALIQASQVSGAGLTRAWTRSPPPPAGRCAPAGRSSSPPGRRTPP